MEKVFLIIDLDQTLADNSHRVNLLPNWAEFHSACDGDKPIVEIIEAVKGFVRLDSVEPLFLTGRTNLRPVMTKTKAWLEAEDLGDIEVVYRAGRDFRKSHIFKKSVVDFKLKEFAEKYPDDTFKVVIIDDDEKIIEAFKENNHQAVLVNQENFAESAEELRSVMNKILFNSHTKTI